ncbi:MAG: ABC transporter substrate-binding protein [Dehalococcoidia bacterium]
MDKLDADGRAGPIRGRRRPSLSLFPRLLALLLIALAIAACGADDQADDGPAASGATPRAPADATLTVAVPSFWAETLDPSMDSQAGLQYHGPMYDHLAGVGPDGRLDARYGLLESWDPGDDATTYTWRLKQGIKWHDGIEVTSADISYSLGHYTRDEARCESCPGLSELLDRVETPDRYTAVVYLNAPHVSFMHYFGPIVGDMPLLPAHRSHETERVIGTGPWKLSTRVPGESIEFTANLDYWDPERVPGFARLRVVAVAEPDMRAEMLKSGAVDMTVLRPSGRAWSTGEAQGDVASVREAGFSIGGPRYVNTTVIRLFTASLPSSLNHSLDFRKALALGIDAESIIDTVYDPGVATVARGSAFFSPLSDGYDPDLPPYPHDPGEARRALAAAGYDGETVYIFSAPSYGLTELLQVNEMIAEDLREVGMTVEVLRADYPELLARHAQRPQDFDDVMPAPLFHGVNYQTWPDVISGIKRYTTSGPQSLLTYHDPERGDRLYAELSAIVDPDARAVRLKQLNREMYDEYWAIPIVWRNEVHGLRPGLSGWAPTDGTAFDLHLETIRPS